MVWLGQSQRQEIIEMNLDKKLIKCRACPRLVDWREEISIVKRKAYQDEKYWGKPVPGFGLMMPEF